MNPPTDLASLRRPDGSVVVPAQAASEVLRILTRQIVADAREHGGQPSPLCRQLLADLYAATRRPPTSAPAESRPATQSVAEAAERMGCSTRWVRQLLAGGKLPGRRAGGVWLVELPTSEAPSDAA